MNKNKCEHMYGLFKVFKKYEIQECIYCKQIRKFYYDHNKVENV